jgi:AcrR family transcriptional regulator
MRRLAKKCPVKKLPKPSGWAAPADEFMTKGERTRAALIEAGYQLFITQGYHATSTRDIAAAVGLAVGSIYNYFRTKEDIYMALLKERHPLLQILPAVQQAQGDTVEELVRDAAARMIKALGERHQAFGLMYVELAEFRGRHLPQLFKMSYPAFMAYAQRLTLARGPLRDVPLPIMLRVFLGMFFSYFITELLTAKQLPVSVTQDAFDCFVDIYLHGVLAEG